MNNVSTGAPDGKWKAWVKWLRLFSVILAAVWLLRYSEQHPVVALVCGALVVLVCARTRLSAQCLDLLIDGHPVQLTLYTDVSRRVWIEWTSRNERVRARIMEPYCQGWVDHDICLGGRQYSLRIFVEHFGGGYLVSNHGRGFDMVVLRNTCAW